MMIPLSKVTKEQLGIDVPMSTLRRWVLLGIYPGVKIGGRWFVDPDLFDVPIGRPPAEKPWAGIRAMAKASGLIEDERQIGLPIDEASQIEAGKLATRDVDGVIHEIREGDSFFIPELRDPYDPEAPEWVRASVERMEAGYTLPAGEAARLRAWVGGRDEQEIRGGDDGTAEPPGEESIPLSPGDSTEGAKAVEASPATIPDVRVYVRSWTDPDAPDWAKAIGEALYSDDVVAEEDSLRLRNWMKGEDA